MANGVLTREDLMELWISVVDPAYSDPLLNKPNSGLELIESGAEMLAKVSANINAVQQQMFIMPWSGQSGDPAGGERRATVVLTLTRTLKLELPLMVRPLGFAVEQRMNDFSKTGPIEVSTDRVYLASQARAFMPGQRTIELEFVAELPGGGYNQPPATTIKGILQRGADLGNVAATVVPGVNAHQLVATELADTPSPDNIGSYVEFLAGANAGRVVRVVGYANPEPGASGGTLILAADGVFVMSGIAGDYLVGEQVQQATSGATGVVQGWDGTILLVTVKTGVFAAGLVIDGLNSGAAATLGIIELDPALVAEVGTATWRMLSWVDAWGMTATNAEAPTGGRSPFLDEHGGERGVVRASNEDDSTYRERVHKPADVVVPNALRRVANKILAPVGIEVCFREVGTPLLPGYFHDAGSNDAPGAFDLELVDTGWTGTDGDGFARYEWVEQTNATGVSRGQVVKSFEPPYTVQGLVRTTGPEFTTAAPIVGETSGHSATPTSIGPGLEPYHRFVMMFDLVEFRAFFMMGVPSQALVVAFDGLFHDDAYRNAHDSIDLDTNFFDSPLVGTAVQSSPLYASVWNAVQEAKAGGVRWQLYIEDLACA